MTFAFLHRNGAPQNATPEAAEPRMALWEWRQYEERAAYT